MAFEGPGVRTELFDAMPINLLHSIDTCRRRSLRYTSIGGIKFVPSNTLRLTDSTAVVWSAARHQSCMCTQGTHTQLAVAGRLSAHTQQCSGENAQVRVLAKKPYLPENAAQSVDSTARCAATSDNASIAQAMVHHVSCAQRS